MALSQSTGAKQRDLKLMSADMALPQTNGAKLRKVAVYVLGSLTRTGEKSRNIDICEHGSVTNNWSRTKKNLKSRCFEYMALSQCAWTTLRYKIPVSTILGLEPTRTYTSKTLQRKTSVDDSIVSWSEVRSTFQCRSYNGDWDSIFSLNPKILILAWALYWQSRIAPQVVKTVP